MSTWGTKRRNFIILIVLLVALILGAIFFLVVFYEEPTCFDNKQNGNEAGIDCGGSCALLCDTQIIPLTVHWTRYFEIVPGLYNAIAYVENPNVSAGTERLDYIFRLFDTDGVQLIERKGSVRVDPKEIIPIVEPNLNTGKLNAKRVTFEIANNPVWAKQKPKEKVLVINDENLFLDEGLPEITAKIFNSSINTVKKISVVVIVYDKNDNAIASSRTFIEKLSKDESANLIFTWPSPFSGEYTRFEIIPLYESVD